MAIKIRILTACNNKDSLLSLKKLLEPYSEFKITSEASNGQEAIQSALDYQPDIILMHTDMALMDGFNAAKKLSAVTPHIGIILFGSAESVEIIKKAMHSGAGDFLEYPFNGDKLRDSILSLYLTKKEQKRILAANPLFIPERNPKVISVFSSKGGVGKTVLATNLAVALSDLTREDILLLDLDLQFGDVADLLNVKPKSSIINLLEDRENIEVKELEKFLSVHESGIKVLSAPEQPEQADLVGEKEVKGMLSLFLQVFDFIVIDMPPLFNEVVLSAIEHSDYLLLITTLEVPTLKNIKGSLDILKKLEFPEDKIRVIINRFNEHRELKKDDIKRYLGIPDVWCIEDNPEIVSTSINLGEPFVHRYPETAIAKQVIELSKVFFDYRSLTQNSFMQRLFRKR